MVDTKYIEIKANGGKGDRERVLRKEEKCIGVSWGVLSTIRIIWLTMEQWNVARIARCASYKRAIEDNNEGNEKLAREKEISVDDSRHLKMEKGVLWWKYTDMCRYWCLYR